MTDTQAAPGATGAASQQGAAAAAGTGAAAAPAGTGTNSNGQQGQSQQQAPAQGSGQGQQQQQQQNGQQQQQGQAQQGDGTKGGAPNKGDATYTLTLPEGSLLPASEIETVAAYAKARGLSNEAAQEVLAQRHDAVKAFHESATQKFRERATQWVNEAKADKSLAGEQGQDFDANAGLAKRALNHFFGKELDAVLNETGYGNHPAILRGFLKIAKAMGEDTLAQGVHGGGQPKDAASVLYGGGQQ